jgi:hypothetical protein
MVGCTVCNYLYVWAWGPNHRERRHVLVALTISNNLRSKLGWCPRELPAVLVTGSYSTLSLVILCTRTWYAVSRLGPVSPQERLPRADPGNHQQIPFRFRDPRIFAVVPGDKHPHHRSRSLPIPTSPFWTQDLVAEVSACPRQELDYYVEQKYCSNTRSCHVNIKLRTPYTNDYGNNFVVRFIQYRCTCVCIYIYMCVCVVTNKTNLDHPCVPFRASKKDRKLERCDKRQAS